MSQYNDNSKRAAALKYDPNKNNSPVVIASGAGYIADKVVKIAEETGVPVYKDDSLAVLLSQLDMGSEIPEELFSAIVDIYVYFLNFKLQKDGAENE
ncbi:MULTISPECIES: EscU/YscU/HrcU family type III secretion system export apparatus switch protein [unclassified Sedimentibacter]|uniref:EscU/YscU/HrcU family type III secretion system export apparatus switch protein n=1 Tax=unclassified Sedimentibacter TaxID=2649220 RepID=UPI0027E0E213|nr:EscU/YscU/HrcU family type III secretion system export apparatus switch protein [Sedimentibacter sp. MB35-C1]WMJ78626.1 EscU/YscU/HrcU family type III secretion system export apparatus switch protein [Sedimentibacter sp. MB35-C1]